MFIIGLPNIFWNFHAGSAHSAACFAVGDSLLRLGPLLFDDLILDRALSMTFRSFYHYFTPSCPSSRLICSNEVFLSRYTGSWSIRSYPANATIRGAPCNWTVNVNVGTTSPICPGVTGFRVVHKTDYPKFTEAKWCRHLQVDNIILAFCRYTF